MERRRARLDHHTALRVSELPGGLIHGHLFRDKVLWRDGELVALLDFESASRVAFSYDLMVCVHSGRFGDDFDCELVSARFEGYETKRRLEPRDRGEHSSSRDSRGAGVCDDAEHGLLDARAGRSPPTRDFGRCVARLDAPAAGELDAVMGV